MNDAAGYQAASPVTDRPRFDLDKPTVSRQEIAIAVADAGCKQRTRLLETWAGVKSGYQKKQIAAGIGELTKPWRSTAVA
ncbi:hypothetical protein [Streptomyces sp. NPDC006285]|uniref:hypothetical protein n=1 Tax=Streptomyces sp. NPDC006285 TaxID=3364742 RepID=UPI003696E018